ncbi:MAG: hypothetical protein ABJZ55_20510 [Fuerstiella sp.]
MTLTHRRSSDALSDNVIQFAESGNEQYGENIWQLDSELPAISAELVAFAADYYSVDADDIADEVNPEDIVCNAGVWDDTQFVSDLWQAMESGDIAMAAGYRTVDGAVVIDRDSVVITKLA